jgi:positive regulator of sigma E activity
VIKLAKILKIDESEVTLKIESNTQCSDCESHCSDGFLGFLFHKNREGKLLVSRLQKHSKVAHLTDEKSFFNQPYKQGDIIGLKFEENQLFKLALVLYGLPIILIVVCLFLTYYLFNYLGLNADIGGVLGLLLGLFFSKGLIKSSPQRFKPKVEFFK